MLYVVVRLRLYLLNIKNHYNQIIVIIMYLHKNTELIGGLTLT